MRDSSQLRFNIIYTPGTAKYLQLFVFSLLKWLDCSFRLVANGCPEKEVRLLQELCHSSPRLEFLALPFAEMGKHDQALSYLQAQEQSKYFCFMDSDILATGNFLSVLTPYLGQYAGVFSGSPAFCREDERILPAVYPRMHGRFNWTDTGMCLGSTYLAIYDNRVLAQVIESTGISFARYSSTDIPSQYQNWFAEMDLEKVSYDTGKLLNLLLLAQGERLVFQESECLLHIGGIARQALRKRVEQTEKTSGKRPIVQRALGRLRRLLASLGIENPKGQHTAATDVITRMHAARRKRFALGHHFFQLLQSLHEDHPLPAVPDTDDPEIREKIDAITVNIVALHKEFRDQLVH